MAGPTTTTNPEVPAEAAALLRNRFALDEFRPGQAAVVAALLAGRPALAIFPTGGGKSLCYQLPALLLEGITLVVSPLIALMKDQVDSMQAIGVEAARLDSTLTSEEREIILERLRSGGIKLLYVAPERLADPRFLAELEGIELAMMAIDEAHCISEWGHNFRPDYLRLERLAKKLDAGRVLALTATATPQVAEDICSSFGIPAADTIRTGFRRPNLCYRITPCEPEGRRAVLLQRLEEHQGAAIVYVTQQLGAEALAGFLKRSGIDARAYHAGLRDDHRAAVQEAFMSGELRVVVATIAFGMGIDKADIRAVFHFNLPKSLENYVQETGRAGRDGQPAHCEMLACADDLTVLQNFTYGDTPTPQGLRHLIDHLLRLGDEFDVSHWGLSTTNDIRSAVVETVLAYLELDGVLEPDGAYTGSMRFWFIRSLESALAGYSEETQALIRGLVESAKTWRGTYTVNVAEAAEELGVSKAEASGALTELRVAGDIQLRPYGIRHRYRIAKRPAKLSEVVADTQELFREREARDIERLRRVVELAEQEGCIVRRLLSEFGEEMQEDCGTCSRCTGDLVGEIVLPGSDAREISPQQVEEVHQLLGEKQAALRSPRQLARFLCGVTSPAASLAKLNRHDSFGLLEAVAFEDVLAFAESLNAG